MTRRFAVRTSRIAGAGVFAARFFPAGAMLMRLSGRRITEDEADELLESGRVRADDVFQVQDDQYLVLDELPVRINHSCDPNSGIRGENELVSLRNIRSGEEITYDYSTVVGRGNDGWQMRCACGSDICRRIVGSISSVPKDRLVFYRDRGALPRFITEELAHKRTTRARE